MENSRSPISDFNLDSVIKNPAVRFLLAGSAAAVAGYFVYRALRVKRDEAVSGSSPSESSTDSASATGSVERELPKAASDATSAEGSLNNLESNNPPAGVQGID
ncbi:MAG: hypothetical protein EOP09_08915 [Proteobacteria bacterium]|nr:MAG: hypothetical protein EOP09_08915 [Pseudomonadota bacterium]